MFFGNSKITLHRTLNCDRFGLTDKNFLVSISNGSTKDNMFLGYFKNCLDSEKQLRLSELVYVCSNNLFCETGLTAEVDPISLAIDCGEIFNGISGDFYTIENSFPEFGVQTISPFCTGGIRYTPWWEVVNQDCSCPANFQENESNSFYTGDCFKSYPIELLGLNSTSEIDPCRFFFFSEPLTNNWNWYAYSGNFTEKFILTILYRSYDEGGREICNALSMETSNNACAPQLICWPPGGEGDQLIQDPITGLPTTPCDICSGITNGSDGDACNPDDIVIANAICRCPHVFDCWADSSTSGSENCFFFPGMSSAEPCVNGSWNGQTCVDGYNDICGSEECVDRICKEMDWFISNYGASSDSFAGYSKFGYDFGFEDSWFISCGQTSVNTFFDGAPGTTTFGNTTNRRSWDKIVGMLHHLVNNDISDGDGTTTISFHSDVCRDFYPTQVCCGSSVKGSSFYDCPFCPITGFSTSFNSQSVCCCSSSITPIILGLGGYTGFDNAITSGISMGTAPQTS